MFDLTSKQRQPSLRDSRRRLVNRRAAVAVIVGLVGFAALQTCTTMWFQWRWPGLRDADYEARVARFRDRAATAGPNAKSVIMIGSSRTMFGLRGATVENILENELVTPALICNLGKPGAGPIIQLLYVQRLIEDGIHPDLLLLEVVSAPLFRSCSHFRDVGNAIADADAPLP